MPDTPFTVLQYPLHLIDHSWPPEVILKQELHLLLALVSCISVKSIPGCCPMCFRDDKFPPSCPLVYVTDREHPDEWLASVGLEGLHIPLHSKHAYLGASSGFLSSDQQSNPG